MLYPQERFPYVWEWILEQAQHGAIKIPLEVINEVSNGDKNDVVRIWCQSNKDIIQLSNDPTQENFNKVILEYTYEPKIGKYGDWLNEKELDIISTADPYLAIHALDLKNQGISACIVTAEVTKPKRVRTNRKIPDICASMNIQCVNIHFFLQVLNFKYK